MTGNMDPDGRSVGWVRKGNPGCFGTLNRDLIGWVLQAGIWKSHPGYGAASPHSPTQEKGNGGQRSRGMSPWQWAS